MQKILAKELGMGNIKLSIRLWENLTTREFDIGNVEYYVSLFNVITANPGIST